MKKLYSFLLFAFLCSFGAYAQTTVGNASAAGSTAAYNEYELTPAQQNQRGAVWINTPINLANAFTVSGWVNFGNITGADAGSNDLGTGADGIAFVLQTAGLGALGGDGENIGYGGITSSFAIEMDTWQNDAFQPNPTDRKDPESDHVAFMAGGDPTHNTMANVHLVGDLEDGAWHPITISWNPATDVLSLTLDGNTYNYNGDVAAMLGAGDVYWGFTSATGGAVNNHRVRIAIAPQVDCSAYTVTAGLPSLGCGPANVIYIGYGPQSVTAVASPADPASTYTWYMVGNATPVATGATFTPTMAGSYYVVATNGVCTASTEATAITVVDIRCGKPNQNKVYICHKPNGNGKGINGTINGPNTLCVDAHAVPAHLAHGDCLGQCESLVARMAPIAEGDAVAEEAAQLASVYPNPSRGQVQLKLANGKAARSEIQIVNSRGIVVERRTVAGNAQNISFDLKKYGTGVFLVKIVNGATTQTEKVLVQD